jgi:hypothetical protein
MADPKLHDLVFCYVNGNLLSDNQEVETRIETDSTIVKTTVKGFAGITPGGPVRMVSCKGVVPLDGFEFDSDKAMIRSEVVTLRLVFGGSGKSTTTKGFITQSGVGSGMGKTTEQNWEFTGEPSEFA